MKTKKTLFKIEVWLNENDQWCSQYELPPIDCDETLSVYTRFLEELTRILAYVPGSDTLIGEKEITLPVVKDSCDGCEICKHK